MRYNRIKKGHFLSRPKPFYSECGDEWKDRNMSCEEYGEVQGTFNSRRRCISEEASNPNRKTKYDLVQVYKGKTLVNMDSQMPNALVEEWLKKGKLFQGLTKLQREKKYGNSRFDLYAEYQGKKAFIEVKGVTLEQEGIARFPDAPTLRGLKHIRELEQCIAEGYEAWIFFVIQMKGVQRFQPNWTTQPNLGRRCSMRGRREFMWKHGIVWLLLGRFS